MKRLLLLSTFYILCASLINAAGLNDPSPNNQAPSEFTCNLPAPANLVISNVTATSATGTWSAVAGAIGYNVEVRLASTNALEYSNFTTATTETATGLIPSADHIMLVTSVCPNQQNGQVAAIVNFTTDVVIELLVVNYQPPACPTPGAFNIYYNHQIYPDNLEIEIGVNTIYWLEVKQQRSGQEKISRYLVSYRAITGALIGFVSDIQPMNANPEGAPLLGPTEGWAPYNNGSTTYYETANITVDSMGDQLVQFKIKGEPQTLPMQATLRIQAFDYGFAPDGRYQIKIMSCSTPPGGQQDRNADFSVSNQASDIPQVNVFPNPFTGMVHLVNQGETSFDNGSIELTDLAGKVLIAKNNVHLDAQQMLDLETASLVPGMYLLNVNTGTETHTIKLVKSE